MQSWVCHLASHRRNIWEHPTPKEISKLRLNLMNHFLLLCSLFFRILHRFIAISTTFSRQSKLRQRHAPFGISPTSNAASG
jgi:hypothetical protein